jgi:hypothetical protein
VIRVWVVFFGGGRVGIRASVVEGDVESLVLGVLGQHRELRSCSSLRTGSTRWTGWMVGLCMQVSSSC